MRGEQPATAMKFQNQNIAQLAALPSANESTDPFFAEPVGPEEITRDQTHDAIARLLVWLSDGPDNARRGVRVTIALYCLRPELAGRNAVRQLAQQLPDSVQGVRDLAKNFAGNVTDT